MQSGISVAKELQDEFSSLLESSTTFALLVTIQKESLVSTATIPRTSDVFEENLAQLGPHINKTTALYAILRRHEEAPRLAMVTYVPDEAHVRQKTLFASTRLALVRELGSEHFRETLFMTTPEEVTGAGFRAVDAHNGQAAPLTEEERSLGEVKRAEMAAGQGTAYREIHLSRSLQMPVSQDAIAAMREIGAGTRTVAMLKINPATESVELLPESPSPASVAELRGAISATEPRFTFFRFRHTHEGAAADPVLFVYTCPSTPGNRSIKNRMMYPLMKRAVLAVAEEQAELTLAKRFEVEEPGELTDEDVLADLYPREEVRQTFTRPKRPGR
ncbi:Twinfilin [Escovopsis weberi]|uniref:Twinfilin n=1 Tax=Escovopsis weberi TaxID=150374 RepID=A0A0M9VTR9_ESCWE|nr:Twinfilin [Escovopsis weberi]